MWINGKYEYHRMGIGTSAGMQAAEHLHALLVRFHSLNCYCCNFVFIIISAESYLHGILS